MPEHILKRWDITIDDLTGIVDNNPSLRGMIFGYLAEIKLREKWFSGKDITECVKYDDHDRHKKGDLTITYKGQSYIIECKSLQTNSIIREGNCWAGKVQVDASDKRKIRLPKGKVIETTCLMVGEFDILAVNVFSFDGKWKFVFARNDKLPRTNYKKYTKAQRKYLLATLVDVSWPPALPFYDEPFVLLDEIARERG